MYLLWAYFWTHTTSVHNDWRAAGPSPLTASALALWAGSISTAGSDPVDESGPIGECGKRTQRDGSLDHR